MATQDQVGYQSSTDINGKLPGQAGYVPYPTTPALPDTGNISGASLAPQTPVNYQQPEQVPPPVVTPPPETPLPSTPKSDAVSSAIQDALGLQNTVAGEGAYRNQQLQAQGLTPVIDENGNTTYQNKDLVNLQNHLKQLTAESQQIPLQIQQNANGTQTAGGIATIQTAALRNNAIASLGVQAQIAGQKDNIVLARNLVEQMVTVKYGQAEADLKAKLANIDLLLKDPSLTEEQAQRADARALKLKAEQNKLDQAKEDSATIASWAVAMSKYQPTDPTQPKPSALEIDNVMKLAKANDPEALKKALAIYAKYSNDPQATLQAANALELQRLNIQKVTDENALAKAKGPTEIAQAKASLALTNANIVKTKADAEKLAIENKTSVGFPDTGAVGVANTQGRFDAALQGLSPAEVATVKLLADYKMPLPSGFALKAPYFQKLLGTVSQYDPTFDAKQYGVRMKLNEDFTSGKAAGNIKSLNTAIAHLDTLSSAADKLVNRWSPIWNTATNFLETQSGDPRVANFNNAASAVTSELAAVFKGTGASDQEIKAWKNNLDSSQSPEQLKGAIDTAIELMAGRMQALQNQWEQGMGKPKDFNFLSPKSEGILSKLGVDTAQFDPVSGTSGQNTTKPTIAPPSGEIWVTRNGVVGSIPLGEFNPQTDKKL